MIVAVIAISLFSGLPLLVSFSPAKKLAEAEKRVSEGNAGYVEIIKDILSGIPVIKNFRAEKEIQKRFEADNGKIESIKYARRFAEENVNLLSTATSVIMRLGVFIAGAWMAVSGTGVTPEIVLVFLQLVNFVISPIEQMPSRLASRKAAIAIMDKLADFLFENDEIEGTAIPQELTAGISVRELSFGYEKNKEVLRNINLHFQSGQKYAIVGGSGSGKTTSDNIACSAKCLCV